MSLPPSGWEIPKEIQPTEEGATVGPDYLTIGASGGPGLHDHCHQPQPSTVSQEWLSARRPRLYTTRDRISHRDRSDTTHERPSSRDHRPLDPAASPARATSPAADRPPTPDPPRPDPAGIGRQPVPADHRPR